ncbi:MAG TPA: ACP phosphodiesterase [Verrucomicrobiae bacterium]|nr:ACP phosphodiesterase [Verrucomicrobiae bacterium]
MNWLAHLLLSEQSATFRIGNLVPDLMMRTELEQVPEAFRDGIECHRYIDAFTDAHPVVRRSMGRLASPHRRFAPILMDIFYDHFLSVNWTRHCPQPLHEFLHEVYDSFDGPGAQLPATTQSILQRMRQENWLGSYGDVAGVQITLERVARRLRRSVPLGEAVTELQRNYDALGADFKEFFPELRSQVEARFVSSNNFSAKPACL